jgi:hypothetical protein
MTDMQSLVASLKSDGVHYTRKLNEDDTISVWYNQNNMEDIFDWYGKHIATITYDDVDGSAFAFQTHDMTKEEVYSLEKAKSRTPMLEVLLDDKTTNITRDAENKFYALYDGKVHVFAEDWTYLHTLESQDQKTYVITGEKDGQIFWSYHTFSNDFIAIIDGSLLAIYHYNLKNISIIDCNGSVIEQR